MENLLVDDNEIGHKIKKLLCWQKLCNSKIILFFFSKSNEQNAFLCNIITWVGTDSW